MVNIHCRFSILSQNLWIMKLEDAQVLKQKTRWEILMNVQERIPRLVQMRVSVNCAV